MDPLGRNLDGDRDDYCVVIVPARSHRPIVAWEGPQSIQFGMAVVNRELCRALARFGDVELGLGAPDVHVRHQWPPDFTPPAGSGRWVVMQPWELGSVPRAWVEPLNELVDELWVPSRYVRQCFLRSGVDPSRLVVVPLGIDPARFDPSTQPRSA